MAPSPPPRARARRRTVARGPASASASDPAKKPSPIAGNGIPRGRAQPVARTVAHPPSTQNDGAGPRESASDAALAASPASAHATARSDTTVRMVMPSEPRPPPRSFHVTSP